MQWRLRLYAANVPQPLFDFQPERRRPFFCLLSLCSVLQEGTEQVRHQLYSQQKQRNTVLELSE